MPDHPTANLLLRNISPREWSHAIDYRHQTIGRAADADIRTPPEFPLVSRRHAEVWGDKYGMWIRDLASQNGTRVNEFWLKPLSQARIVVRDRIWLGGAELEVVEAVALPEQKARRSRKRYDPDETPITPDPVPLARQMCEVLSPAESDCLLWLARGYHKDVEIGQLLHRSPHTVKTELHKGLQKLGLRSRAEFLAWLKRANAPGRRDAGGGGINLPDRAGQPPRRLGR